MPLYWSVFINFLWLATLSFWWVFLSCSSIFSCKNGEHFLKWIMFVRHRVTVLPQRHPSRSSSVSSMRFVNWQRRSAKSRSVELWICLVYHISVCTFVFQSLFFTCHISPVQMSVTEYWWAVTSHRTPASAAFGTAPAKSRVSWPGMRQSGLISPISGTT